MRISKKNFCVITGNLCTCCSVYCVVGTKKAQGLQADLHLRDRNTIITSVVGGSGFIGLLREPKHFLWFCFGLLLSFHI